MGKKSEKLPEENIRASSEEFLGAAPAAQALL
jgi:hypothetical protein